MPQADVLYAMASDLLAFVAEALDASDLPDRIREGVVPGGSIADDTCCDDDGEGRAGQLAASIDRIFAADENLVDVTQVDGCAIAVAAVDLRVRYSVCVPSLNDDGEAPSAAALDAAARITDIGAWALFLGACRWATAWPEHTRLGSATPTGPEGNCLGWDIVVTAEVLDPPDDAT